RAVRQEQHRVSGCLCLSRDDHLEFLTLGSSVTFRKRQIMETGSPKRRVMTRSFAAYFVAYMDNDLTTSAAAISYFAILVLFPTLLLLLAVGNQIMVSDAGEKYVIGQVLAFLPGAQGFVRKNLESIAAISGELTASCLFIMLWAASWLFTVIEK